MDWENVARTKPVSYKTQTLPSGAEPAAAGGERGEEFTLEAQQNRRHLVEQLGLKQPLTM